jgi:hypothetical protein
MDKDFQSLNFRLKSEGKAVDPVWLVIDRGEELLSKVKKVSRQIDERVHRVLAAGYQRPEAHS